MPTDDAPTLVNIELAELKDCSTPEPGVRSKSVGMARVQRRPVSSGDPQRELAGSSIGFLSKFCQPEGSLLSIEPMMRNDI